MSHPSEVDDITTINYILHWPYLENPSNTTFVGHSQIDICRCPRPDLPPQDELEPGHIYTRYKCLGPEVQFKSGDEELWVLQEAHGPINMLRPATAEEAERRKQIHDDADPSAYQRHNFILLTGPCPRGRYQAYATQKWLESLSASARQNISSLSLLIQSYEEDCLEHFIKQAYTELAKYIVQHLSGFKTLCLHFWNDGWTLWSAVAEFSVIFDMADAKIVIKDDRWFDGYSECADSSAFLGLIYDMDEA
ncbi:hypothetical protein PtrSN002B_001838 [Pyrenophora tritici-repentis]|uniref:Uncharacterized protein n=2 Tax=Pyrenophora tritici-repentis TaxID=45151 RepID=A0A2W1DRP1_9PLEO|nr:uncharacterized protein PTRG_06386 [Pyrenophora tritici-repentis Pt-1C-BFP]KAA8613447.1 hypothetical protein PtrV1_12355 [Pyrenophora tritici-repentis]EDU49306.1 conserved hypothetical protein [Pyrenophora tritici-repentis Pt-1C-BFP]KAF7445158.1 hypothetical protein A1F99_101440 [Pyrenophora tritici-repentis]KAF7565424.1 hypothetical protein PtrM4_048580 [Pyrenophora tritici-repentis]KAG9380440.1 hypothetical protein A1F94_009335 [Pyrenophora tritici-repentis]